MVLSMHNKKMLREQFERDGYITVKNVISPERVTEIRAGLLKEFEKNENKDGVIFDLFCQYPEVLDTFCNERVVEALKAVLGDDFILIADSSAMREKYNQLHTDTTTQENAGWNFHKKPDFRMVTVGMYLQDNNEYGGGLYVVPGSHLKQDPIARLRQLQEDYYKSFVKRVLKKLSLGKLFIYNNYEQRGVGKGGFDIPSSAGDVLIFDMRIIHRASHPTTKQAAPGGGKLAIFSRCSANNLHAQTYTEFLSQKGNKYTFLQQQRNLEPLKKCSEIHGFQAL